MRSTFYKITTALINLVSAEPALAASISRARSRPVHQTVPTAINVQFSGAIPEAAAIAGAPIDWVSKFSIECFARCAKSSDDNDDVVDPLLLGVYARIAADTTLGGLVDNVGEPMIEAEYSAEGERTGWVCMTFPIEHRTEQSTLE